jgi:hypothetical protein
MPIQALLSRMPNYQEGTALDGAPKFMFVGTIDSGCGRIYANEATRSRDDPWEVVAMAGQVERVALAIDLRYKLLEALRQHGVTRRN